VRAFDDAHRNRAFHPSRARGRGRETPPFVAALIAPSHRQRFFLNRPDLARGRRLPFFA
jgi:hypothetical protein